MSAATPGRLAGRLPREGNSKPATSAKLRLKTLNRHCESRPVPPDIKARDEQDNVIFAAVSKTSLNSVFYNALRRIEPKSFLSRTTSLPFSPSLSCSSCNPVPFASLRLGVSSSPSLFPSHSSVSIRVHPWFNLLPFHSPSLSCSSCNPVPFASLRLGVSSSPSLFPSHSSVSIRVHPWFNLLPFHSPSLSCPSCNPVPFASLRLGVSSSPSLFPSHSSVSIRVHPWFNLLPFHSPSRTDHHCN